MLKPVGKKIKEDGPIEAAQVHFSFISKQLKNIVTEETLRNLFNRYGDVKDVSLKKSVINHVSSLCFITFDRLIYRMK